MEEVEDVKKEIEDVKKKIKKMEEEMEALPKGDQERASLSARLTQLETTRAQLEKRINILMQAATPTQEPEGVVLLLQKMEQLEQLMLSGKQEKVVHVDHVSSCSTNKWNQVERVLRGSFQLMDDKCAPCCLNHSVQQSLKRAGCLQDLKIFNWTRGKSEDEHDMTGHLDANVLPEGVRALAVQRLSWLHCSIRCAGGTVEIGTGDKPCHTDYLLLLKEGYDRAQEWMGGRGGLPASRLRSLAGFIVGLYEAKTTQALTGSLDKHRRQALLEYLAVNEMLSTLHKIVVIMGDGNQHHCIHPDYKDARSNAIHIAWPATPALPTISEDEGLSPGSPMCTPSAAAITHQFVKEVLAKTREQALEHLQGVGGASHSQRPVDGGSSGGGEGGGSGGGEGGSNGSSGGGNEGGAGDIHSGDGDGMVLRGSSDGGEGSSSPKTVLGGGGPNNAANRALSLGADRDPIHHPDKGAVHPVHMSAGTKLLPTSSSGYRSGVRCEDGSDDDSDDDSSHAGQRGSVDEGLLEAAKDNALAQAYMSVLDDPDFLEWLGVERGAKFAFTPPTLEQYAASFKFLPPPSCQDGECGGTGGTA